MDLIFLASWTGAQSILLLAGYAPWWFCSLAWGTPHYSMMVRSRPQSITAAATLDRRLAGPRAAPVTIVASEATAMRHEQDAQRR
jgi:hypothetical protein